MAHAAHQLSLSVPENQRYIVQAAESDPSVFNDSLETQLTPLVCTYL
jgi:hypothetical protein